MPELKKLVLKVEVHDLKDKKKAMKAVSSLSGIDSLSMDMKDRKLTVVGDFDPVEVVSKLRKHWRNTEIVTVGPPKEPEKKKEEPKKEDDKGKKKTDSEMYADLMKAYYVRQNPYMTQQYVTQNPYMTQQYAVHSAEEDPNSCVIC